MVEYENQGLRSLQEDPYVSWFHCTTEAFLISTLYTLWRDWNCSLLKKGVACHYTPSLLISMVAAFHPDTGGPPWHTSPSFPQLQTEHSSIQSTPCIWVAQKGVLLNSLTIIKRLAQLRVSQSSWPRWLVQLPQHLPKSCRHLLTKVKTQEDWRSANISPIFKKGKKNKPMNYVPVPWPLYVVRWQSTSSTAILWSSLNSTAILL